MPTNVDSMVQEAIQTYRAGNKAKARELLEKATELDSYNENAWMWLSAVVDTPKDQRVCLENVLVINPDNENAKKGLQMLSTAAPPKTPETPSTMMPPTATSSASAVINPDNEISHKEYDDWVSGLKLSPDQDKEQGKTPTAGDISHEQFANIFADAFQDDFEEESKEFNPLAEEEEAATSFDQEPFTNNDLFADDAFGLDELRQASAYEESINDDDDLFLSDEELLFGTDTNSIPEGPFTSDALDFATEPAKPPTASRRARSRSPSSPTESSDTGPLLADDAFDTVTSLDPGQYFQAIPKQIKATRLPGTREKYPLLVLIGFIGLIVLNIGAATLLFTNL